LFYGTFFYPTTHKGMFPIFFIFWNLKFHPLVHKSCSLNSPLIQLNPVHISQPIPTKISFWYDSYIYPFICKIIFILSIPCTNLLHLTCVNKELIHTIQ
jgi:hypothetical protein